MSDEEPTSIREAILDKMSALIAAAFGLVAALAWNEAIKAVFREVFGPTDQVMPLIMYAIVVTVIAVILTLIIARAVSKAKTLTKKEQKEFPCNLCDYTTEIESEFLEHMVKVHAANEDKFMAK